MTRDVVIVGGGLAGQRCCEALRRSGFDGSVTILCSEALPPYDRPPLSKEALAKPGAPATFRPGSWYSDNGVELLLSTAATGLDPDVQRVLLAGGETLGYERLLVATGAAPVVPPLFTGYGNVHTVRDFRDALRLRRRLEPDARLVVVGAGFLGLEVAATARALGAAVTVVDIAPVPLGRVLPTEAGRWFTELHRRHDVAFALGDGVLALHASNDRVGSVELVSGRRIECDELMVAVGVRPSTDWLGASGKPLATDASGHTALTNVWAAGDAAAWPDRESGEPRWTQQWEAAARQGASAARAMLGLPPAPLPLPSFWTDQFGIRVQHVGTHVRADTATWEGDPATDDFAVTWWRGDDAIGGLLAGRPADLPPLRRLIQTRETTKGGKHELQGADR